MHRLLPKALTGCPYLILAPMEGVGDRPFRRAMATIGGFNEAVTEFLRVPLKGHVPSLAKKYEAEELLPIPLAAQIMGSDSLLMAEMASALEARGATRIDLNCGCPSNVVTGKGAGSSLLKEPSHLHAIAKSMVQAVSVPVTVKMRSGFEDISLFRENLLAAQESGIAFLTLHPRTKVDGYGPPAKWELIAEAKSLLKIPVVGNGDIVLAEDAVKMIQQTGCDALMIGRGAVMNPFLFQEIQALFRGEDPRAERGSLQGFLRRFVEELPQEMQVRGKMNKIKQLISFLLHHSPDARRSLLTTTLVDFDSFLNKAEEALSCHV